MAYYFIESGQIQSATQPPTGAQQFGAGGAQLLPPQITHLHEGLRAWGDAGFSPGPIAGRNVWFQNEGAIGFELAHEPQPLNHVGLAPDLAAWLVLLDKSMETFVVIARARIIWDVEELGAALGFLTPAFLPAELVRQEPDNWVRVAQALAVAIADGPLSGTTANRHWNGSSKA